MDNDVATLVFGAFSLLVQGVLIFFVVNYTSNQTDLNNWMIALCALGASTVVGLPSAAIGKALQA
jgi:hypothetical protein